MMKSLIACAALAVLLIAGPAAAQHTIVIKFSHVAATRIPECLACLAADGSTLPRVPRTVSRMSAEIGNALVRPGAVRVRFAGCPPGWREFRSLFCGGQPRPGFNS